MLTSAFTFTSSVRGFILFSVAPLSPIASVGTFSHLRLVLGSRILHLAHPAPIVLGLTHTPST